MNTLFFRLLDPGDKATALSEAVDAVCDGRLLKAVVHAVDPVSFRQVPGSPFAYWVSNRLRRLFTELPPFEAHGRTAKVGLTSNADFRFLRLWWETKCGCSEIHNFAKGGEFSPFYSDIYLAIEYDLFHPLPPQFDLAVLDRFACYVPGWEMPKNSSEYLTSHYGFITDYLAEAFHYQFSHTNRYEEVSQRIRLGTAIEGRDEKGIKKTVGALLKILHPDGAPTDAEFAEYVAYAVEGRRRIKEQMNKRKPDEEFANIQLSYFAADSTEVVVYCPESRQAVATQHPVRKALDDASQVKASYEARAILPREQPRQEATPAPVPPDSQDTEPVLQEQHFTILYGDTGYSYESILGPYLRGAKALTMEDPYIRLPHQIQNFVRFCETVVKALTIKKITLITGYEEKTQLADLQDKLGELQQSLLELDIVLDIRLNPNLHDREIRLDTGWIIKIGRGLDFYQRPQSWFEVGANDLSLRKCLETKVDTFKGNAASARLGNGRGN